MITLPSIQFFWRPDVVCTSSRERQYRLIWEVSSDAAISAPRLFLHMYSPDVTLLFLQLCELRQKQTKKRDFEMAAT